MPLILMGAIILSSYKNYSHQGNASGINDITQMELSADYELTAALLQPVNDKSLSDSVNQELNKTRAKVSLLLLAVGDMKQSFEELSDNADQFKKSIDEFAGKLTKNQWTSDEDQKFEVLKKEVMFSNPLLKAQPFVFVTRHQYAPDHHNTATFFPSAKDEYNDGKYQGGGALKIIDFKTGDVKTLLATDEGVIRDPEMHFDAEKIIFSMRKNYGDSYHIYEINIDGQGLKQLTFMKDVDDLDPFYLADDHIAFTSTREPKYCMCNRHIMGNLYRMEPDGSNIYQISKNPLFDGHGTLMPDGRILYDRWEYVDRNFGDAQSLWTSNPDGTNHALYWGNNTPSPGGTIDPRVIPGTNNVVCVFGSCHDRPWGAVAVIDRRIGMDGPKPVVKIWPESAMKFVWESEPSPYYGIDNMTGIEQKYEDPFPLSEKYFICSGQIRERRSRERMGLYLLDIFGNKLVIHSEEVLGCYDPIPVMTQKRPAVIPTRRNFTDTTGTFYVQDVYKGTHMEGVKRGDVKFLRIVETPEKRFWTMQGWNGQGVILPSMNWHDFNNKKILGIVPVNEDGSAYFTVPAEKFVYFQLLDKDGMMIQSMRSGTMVQPGEQSGCMGCHEDRRGAASWEKQRMAAAMTQKPAIPEPWHGKNKEFSYREEVQPVFDRYCIQCHQPEKKAGQKLNLTGGTGQVFNTAYAELWIKQYIKPIGAGPAHTMAARSWGSNASRMIELIKEEHGDVKMDGESFDKLVTWIDLNAPYYPSYATSYPDNPFGRSPLTFDETKRLEELTEVKITSDLLAASSINFDEPEKSMALKGLDKKDPKKYKEAIQIITLGKERLAETGINDLDGFEYCSIDQWREEKYNERRQIEEENRQSVLAGTKRYDKDKE